MTLGGICAVRILGSTWDIGWLGQISNADRVWYGAIQDPGASIICSYNVRRGQLSNVITN